ncbi:Bifunctional enzyme IspD/IspF [Geodia barretti]|uniref:2-C-methyl-D-erythritol 4-phosphate cytidylyltransferase, chloroplastic n=1 Tax=Geodia barretti TaxID=519541 RepID=A0AA35SHH1_GEOBA|nr:Bifunctional enzyme IspD/IspF [Geodia barretti]
MGGVDKTFAPLLGIPLIAHTLGRFESSPVIGEIVLVLAPDSVEHGRTLVAERGYKKVTQVCAGGERRQDSVRHGLHALTPCDLVMVHDGARPCVDSAMLERAARTAGEHGATVAGMPVKDTIKRVAADLVIEDTPERALLWQAQTPQVFGYDLLVEAHRVIEGDFTDDAAMVESLGNRVRMFEGSYENIKVTTASDLVIAEAFLEQLVADFPDTRVGIGFDSHPLVPDRRLVLGGVEIPHDHGLEGHSDGDVLVHALMDSLLGAANLGDKGIHFPSSDPRYRDISSLLLLERVATLVKDAGWRVSNVDATMLAQTPRLGPFIQAMRERSATALGISPDRVSIKATTTDHLGFVGRSEGIAVCAVACIVSNGPGAN